MDQNICSGHSDAIDALIENCRKELAMLLALQENLVPKMTVILDSKVISYNTKYAKHYDSSVIISGIKANTIRLDILDILYNNTNNGTNNSAYRYIYGTGKFTGNELAYNALRLLRELYKLAKDDIEKARINMIYDLVVQKNDNVQDFIYDEHLTIKAIDKLKKFYSHYNAANSRPDLNDDLIIVRYLVENGGDYTSIRNKMTDAIKNWLSGEDRCMYSISD